MKTNKTKDSGTRSLTMLPDFLLFGFSLQVLFQIGLFWRQLNLIRDSLIDTKDAVKAAKDTAQATLDANRPWLDVDVSTTESFEDNGAGVTKICFVR